MNRRAFRWLWLVTIFLAISLACQGVSSIGGTVNSARGTALALETSVQSGKNLVATGQAYVTQAEGSSLVQTAKAVVTEQGPQLIETARAFATEQGPSIEGTVKAFAATNGPSVEATLKAFATSEAPGMAETLQALITEQGPSLVNTASAYATSIAGTIGEMPAGVPVFPQGAINLKSTAKTLSYVTPHSLKTVQSFYEQAMPANGWSLVDSSSINTEGNIVLTYQKESREARVILTTNPVDSSTIVMVVVQDLK